MTKLEDLKAARDAEKVARLIMLKAARDAANAARAAEKVARLIMLLMLLGTLLMLLN